MAVIPRPDNLSVATVAVVEVLQVISDSTANPPVAAVAHVLAQPEVLAPTSLEQRIFHMEVDNYVGRLNIIQRNLENLYSLIWLHCKSSIQDKVKNYQPTTR